MDKIALISIIIPVYNREKYLRQCLEIVTNQTYKNLEIIVVNDGSSDISMEIAREFPLKIIEHKQNRGLAAARNTGISVATGDYIHFLDDDDKINNKFYQELVNVAVTSSADMTVAGVINEKNKYKTQIFKKTETFETLEERLKVTYVAKWGYVWRYLFRADFIRKHNISFEEGKLIEDLPFSIQAVYHANKLVTVPNAVYLYVYVPDSIMNTNEKGAKEKRRIDKQYANDYVRNFAKLNNGFKIPGVTSGKIQYLLRKLYRSIYNPYKNID